MIAQETGIPINKFVPGNVGVFSSELFGENLND